MLYLIFSFISTNLLVFTNLWGDKKGHKGQNCHVRVWSKKLYSVCMTMWFRGVKWKETFGWIYPRREFNTQKACLVIILGYFILNQLIHSRNRFCKKFIYILAILLYILTRMLFSQHGYLSSLLKITLKIHQILPVVLKFVLLRNN